MLRDNPHKPYLLGLFHTNSCSLINRICLRLILNNLFSCMTIITETWFNNTVSNAAIEITDHIVYQTDRTTDSGKNRGSGVWIYVNNNIEKHCSPDLKYMIVKYRPFFIPREFTVTIIVALFICPQVNAKGALKRLHFDISSLLSMFPDWSAIVVGDFNHIELQIILPKFHKKIFQPEKGIFWTKSTEMFQEHTMPPHLQVLMYFVEEELYTSVPAL